MHLKSYIRLSRLLTIVIPCMVLLGCFGGGSGPAPVAATPLPVKVGAAINSPMQGLSYVTSPGGKSGLTDADGKFDYVLGDTVTFSIGDIIFGKDVIAKEFVTPVEMTGSSDPLDPDAIRLLQFVQSIDSDGDHSNGITISDATRTAAGGENVDFSDPNFGANNPGFDLQALVDNISDPADPLPLIVSEAEALQNFRDTYEDPLYAGKLDFPFPASFQLAWADEFNAPTLDLVNNWNVETGYDTPLGDVGWGNDEWQLYTGNVENLSIVFGEEVDQSNGYLKISAQCPSAPSCGKRTDEITSARINTKDKHEFKFGKIEARIKVPTGKGAWPAFWSLGAVYPDTPWPFAGEIDFMEVFNVANGDTKDSLFTLHWEDNGYKSTGFLDPSSISFDASEFHIFSAEWDENRIIGKIDGIIYANYPIDPNTQEEFLRPFYLILNVAMGGNPLPDPDATTPWPQEMLVDYVRVFQAVGVFGAPVIDIGFEGPSEFVEFCDGASPCGATGFAGADVSVQPNPEVNDSNLSAMAARFLKFDPMNGELFSGTVVKLVDDLQSYLTQSNKIFTMKVWSSRPVGVEFILQTTPGNGPRKIVTTNGTGWEEFTFDFSLDDITGVTDLVLLFGNGEQYNGTDASDDLLTGATEWTFYFDDIVLQSTDAVPPPPPVAAAGVYTETATDTVLPYVQIIDAGVDYGGNSTVTNQSSTAVAALDGSNVLEATFADSGAGSGGFIFNFGSDVFPPNPGPGEGQDISAYSTLKFGIDTSGMSAFADLVVQLEDGTILPKVFLSAYIPTMSDNWAIYEIPLSDFPGLDLTNLTLLGFWNASSATGDPIVLTFGTLYFDGIMFMPGGGGAGGLAVNGSFETGDFTGWTQFGTSPGNVDQMVDLGIPGNTSSDGSYHAHIVNSVTETNSLIKNANIGIGAVTPNSPYTITFDARGSYAVPGGVAFAEFFSELAGEGVSKAEILGGAPLAINADPEVWTSFTFTGTTGPDVGGGVTLQLGATTGAGNLTEMFYDNITITVGP